MRVSVVIPAYNSERTLAECVAACLAQSYSDREIIVVDDGSQDRTGEIAQSFPVRYLRQDNRGPAAARNAGARMASGEIVAFTDADCVPRPDWIEQLVSGFDSGDTAGVGGTYGIANPRSPLARVVHAEIQVRHKRFADTVDFLGSFNVAYERRAFDAVGGFDEDFRIASAEDNDLAYRLLDNGGTLRFNREAIVDHYHPERLWPYLRTQMRHGFWRMKLYAKHPRRASGDQYAGLSAFLGPPLALLTLVLALALGATIAFAQNPFAAVIVFVPLALTFACHGVIRAKLSGEVRREYSRADGSTLYRLMLFRDIARGIGLVRGVFHFILLGRRTG